MKKAIVGMSGGVDSSVAALLLRDAGWEVTGVTLRLHDSRITGAQSCCSDRDIEDAAAVCRGLGIAHRVLTFRDEFRDKVMLPFCRDYIHGETPNPCVRCNRTIKFPKLFEAAEELGADIVATGHYARCVPDEKTGMRRLARGADEGKDQSYVLYSLTAAQLARVRFPVGELHKAEVRRLAAEHGFVNRDKPDSMDICFVPDGNYARFIEENTGYVSRSGNFVDEQGNVLGRHRGLICYTTGQRRGLGVSADRPLYVLRKNRRDNTVVLGGNEALFTRRLQCREVSFTGAAPADGARLTAKVRYSQFDAACTVHWTAPGRMEVVFEEPQRAVTAGQSCVLYDGPYVVGGGVIDPEGQTEE